MKSQKHLLGTEGRLALSRLVQDKPLLAFDFDGTLAPIVMHPDEARVPPDMVPLLAELAQRLPVVILTGRQVEDVRHRLGFKPTHIVGNHGAEDEVQGPDPALVQALAPFRARVAERRHQLGAAGVSIEDKSASIAIHYRLSPDPVVAREVIDELVAQLPPQVVTEHGKRVVNVLVDGAPDKGDAMQRLMAQYGCASGFYAGDDTNDEPVFERAGHDWVTARVGPRLDDSHARFFLLEQAEMAEVLRQMTRALDPVA
ncbi:trehalose 6-phosphate phosphatase [Roseateles sp. YR242]|uniref:trehalose-phosphatase n=1 Tax=Roseateles sp. YR242 TaxID=1855305 RepID=UPI0008B3D975|nr:trehalose-phosphatase [Roseateles sp. YR242]SEL18731.1 trehalose 6-phosphate phosphatase [Roseateles sp. YR242]